VPEEASKSVTVCFATQDEHVPGSWEHEVNAGKLRYSGLFSTHMTHSFVCTSGRLRLPMAWESLGFFVGAFLDLLLAIAARKIAKSGGKEISRM
jgi:hypothetical protein